MHSLLRKLLTTGHLNVPERERLGRDWIAFEEVRRVVRACLEEGGSFPPDAAPFRDGDPSVFEGAVLAQEGETYTLHVQRASPLAPGALAEQVTRSFTDLDEALRAFIEVNWPDGIDGIRIVSD